MKHADETWRSLDDFNDAAAPPLAADDGPARWSRRRFLSLMGASAALASLAGCRWPEEAAAPFAHRPVGTEPGASKFFATSFDFAGSAQPLLVSCVDGRPIKIEGNPNHPAARGASGIHAQASLLELYDPDRAQGPRKGKAASDWPELDAALRAAIVGVAAKNGERLLVISERTSSPTTTRMRDLARRRFPRARWMEWEAASRNTEEEGPRVLYGQPVRPLFDLAKAKTIVALESDLFSGHPDANRHMRDWADAREPGNGTPPRLYAIESTYSLAGAMADTRVRARREEVNQAAAYLLGAVAKHKGQALAGGEAGIASGPHAKALDAMAAELIASGPGALVIAGPALPTETQTIVAETNRLLGNLGTCRRLIEAPNPPRASMEETLAQFKDAAAQGPAELVLVLGGNPAYDAPPDLEIPRVIKDAKTAFHLGLYQNETSELCEWFAPRAHFLEAWGDATNWDGSLCAVQPMIAPLHDGRSEDEFLAHMMGHDKTKGFDLVQETWNNAGNWNEFLRLGFQKKNAPAITEETPAPQSVENALARITASGGEEIDILFQPDFKIHDGRFGNNPWLQELPDPITNLTWDNAAFIDPETAAERKLSTGDFVSISAGGRKIVLPVYIMPGQAKATVVLPLGYGRTVAGRAARETGWNVYPLRGSQSLWQARGGKLEAARGRHDFACTSDHFLIDPLGMKERERRGHGLVRETSFDEFAKHPAAAAKPAHETKPADLWVGPLSKDGHQWAMTVDLNRCTGCSVCVLACQAENNVPVVGPDEIRRGREMHWLRVDRVYRGSVENPSIRHQPMTCLHCENAPCEQVCPVAATMHSSEGLNEMVYNRCIGTRYCSNNCPVKVRRFNYYNYQGKLDDVEKMRMNPEVTVRGRGVMEKCSLCLQRIAKARAEAKLAGRPLEGADIMPACAQACPARAITFGDLAEKGKNFAKSWNGPRAYEILEELNLGARLRYLVRLNNTPPGQRDKTASHEPDHT